MVETAAYCLERNFRDKTYFFQLLDPSEKGEILFQDINDIFKEMSSEEKVFVVNSESFNKITGSPFAYWVSDIGLELFGKLPPFEGLERTVKVGLQTGDDFRFVRTSWEVKSEGIVRGKLNATPEGFQEQTLDRKKWVPFAKGGAYSPYYADPHLVINWKLNGKELKTFTGSVIRNPDFYVRHEVVSAFVTRSNLVFCHGYPTGACVSGKTICKDAAGVRSLRDKVASACGLIIVSERERW